MFLQALHENTLPKMVGCFFVGFHVWGGKLPPLGGQHHHTPQKNILHIIKYYSIVSFERGDIMKKKAYSLTLPDEIVERLDKYAKARSISRSAACTQVLGDGLTAAEMTMQLQSDPNFMAAFMQKLSEQGK